MATLRSTAKSSTLSTGNYSHLCLKSHPWVLPQQAVQYFETSIHPSEFSVMHEVFAWLERGLKAIPTSPNLTGIIRDSGIATSVAVSRDNTPSDGWTMRQQCPRSREKFKTPRSGFFGWATAAINEASSSVQISDRTSSKLPAVNWSDGVSLIRSCKSGLKTMTAYPAAAA